MVLIIGGAGQGKLDWVKQTWNLGENDVARDAADARTAKVFYGCTGWVRRMLQAGEDPGAVMDELLQANPGLILIFDEVGCGVVPVAPEERHWREYTGRMTCRLAARAAQVVRVLCGLPLVLKGEEMSPCS